MRFSVFHPASAITSSILHCFIAVLHYNSDSQLYVSQQSALRCNISAKRYCNCVVSFSLVQKKKPKMKESTDMILMTTQDMDMMTMIHMTMMIMTIVTVSTILLVFLAHSRNVNCDYCN